MLHGERAIFAALIAVLSLRCSPIMSPADGGFDAGIDAEDAPLNQGTDVTMDETDGTELGRPCRVAADCPSSLCLTGFVLPFCAPYCRVDTDCPERGRCLGGVCLPGCDPSAPGSCATFGGLCTAGTDLDTYRYYCEPLCRTDAPMDGGLCRVGTCDPCWHACTSTGPTTCSTLAPNGAPCTRSDQCAGRYCFPEIDPATGHPTGVIGGMCFSAGTSLPGSAYVPGQALPMGDCPPGSAPFPGLVEHVGDPTFCFATCDRTHVCRLGYSCFLASDTGDAGFSDGLCVPIDCTQRAMSCPAGFRCEGPNDAGIAYGSCVRLP